MKRALLVVALLVGSAHADTVVELPKTKWTLTLPDAWKRVPGKDVIAFKHDAGPALAITRADIPNPDAWVAEKKQAYTDQVEKGIKSKIPGYKRITKKVGQVNGVPSLDVEARREDGAFVAVRVLLYRTYALSLAIEVPRGVDVAIARAIVKLFAPPKDSAS